MNMVTLTEIKRFNDTVDCGSYKDCLPAGMSTDELPESAGSPCDDGDSPYNVMLDPDSDSDGYSPEFNYKDPSKLLGEHIDEDTGFALTDEVEAVSRCHDEPLPYDDDDCDADADDDEYDTRLFYEDMKL